MVKCNIAIMNQTINNIPLTIAILYLGKADNLIKAINEIAVVSDIEPTTIGKLSTWKKTKVPLEYCLIIQAITEDKVKAHELRPDFFNVDGTVKKPNLTGNKLEKIPKSTTA